MGLLVLLCLVGLALACTADRTNEANHVRDAVAAMPGVKSVNMSYVNDFENGPNFRLTLDMPEASIEEIVAVATRVRDTMGDDFDKHRQQIQFDVAAKAIVERQSYGYSGQTADLDPDRVGSDAGLVRKLAPIAGGSTLSRDTNVGSELRTWPVDNPDAVAPQALPILAGEDLTLRIESTDTHVHGAWVLKLPLTAERWQELARTRNAMPATVYSVFVQDGAMREISVGLRAPDTAARDLTAVIDAVAPTADRRLTAQWRVLGGPPTSKEPYGTDTICGRTGRTPPPPSASDTQSLHNYLEATYQLCGA
ncbi:hypothetical protein FZI91_12245 [Mycobacterium sp. CBMA271]|uniref:hypothetical protein n=1 Tax=unclassified Mycobacteroides TaxID=2618759 RepID=UPI0012DF9E81|nr:MULTISPECIES: hypothetical protein [unclassified Mycobacteroides]MUM22465.1 hypothetical protein [Mycobacteroides sp. CBMA 271]